MKAGVEFPPSTFSRKLILIRRQCWLQRGIDRRDCGAKATNRAKKSAPNAHRPGPATTMTSAPLAQAGSSLRPAETLPDWLPGPAF
jgi:hypothetical protein